MTDLRMDPRFADALRRELHRTASGPATSRSRRSVGVGVGVAAMALALAVGLILLMDGRPDDLHVTDDTSTAASTATSAPAPPAPSGFEPQPSYELDPPPGGTRITRLSPVVSGTGSGVGRLDPGPPPVGATHLDYALSVQDAGTVRLPGNGGTVSNDDSEVPSTTIYWTPPASDPGAYEVHADDGIRWSYEAVYTRHEITDWAVNARGETYGVQNERGSPDLVAVAATTGRDGYARRTDLDDPEPRTPAEAAEYMRTRAPQQPIAVYASDGVTRIGTFVIGD